MSNLTIQEIKKLNREIITEEQYTELEYSEYVSCIECLGDSSVETGCEWFSVELIDGTDIDVYVKK